MSDYIDGREPSHQLILSQIIKLGARIEAESVLNKKDSEYLYDRLRRRDSVLDERWNKNDTKLDRIISTQDQHGDRLGKVEKDLTMAKGAWSFLIKAGGVIALVTALAAFVWDRVLKSLPH